MSVNEKYQFMWHPLRVPSTGDALINSLEFEL